MDDVDILVVGGGVIGRVLMHAIKPFKQRALLIDDKPMYTQTHAFDARSIALSNASIRILETLSIWPSLKEKATPIRQIHVSEKGAFGHTRLRSTPTQDLGAVVEMGDLQSVVDQTLSCEEKWASARLVAFDLAQHQATLQVGEEQRTIRARMVVGADGADSLLRTCCHLPVHTKDYHQQALVANIQLSRSHHDHAYERFTADGPIAMLPMSEQRAALIWVNTPARSQWLYDMDEALFLKTLQSTFGYRLGRLTKVGRRSLFPLYQKRMPKKVIQSVVFIGNAAQTLHPIAGQGFNLGLRDVAALVQCLDQHGFSPTALQHYQTMRALDQHVITTGTDQLIRLFGHTFPGLSFARGLGLMMIDHHMMLQRLLSRYASGYGGVIPDLVCGISPMA